LALQQVWPKKDTTFINLSGKAFLKRARPEESPKSPVTIINFGFFSPAESAAWPNTALDPNLDHKRALLGLIIIFQPSSSARANSYLLLVKIL
jgi:hypothetical protein